MSEQGKCAKGKAGGRRRLSLREAAREKPPHRPPLLSPLSNCNSQLNNSYETMIVLRPDMTEEER